MKKFVAPHVALAEGNDQRGTNHPWNIFHVGKDQTVVAQTSAAGFTCARKAAPKAIDGKKVLAVCIAGPVHEIPGKFQDRVRPVPIPGIRRDCFVVGKLAVA